VKSFLILLLGIAVGAAAAWYGPRYFAPAPAPVAPNGLPSHSAQFEPIKALGRILPSDGIIEIGAVPTEQIQTIAVEVGARVSEGTELARLASYDLLEQQIAALQAKREEAVAQVAAEKALLNEQIARARLAFEEAKLAEGDIQAQREQMEFLKQKRRQEATELERLRKGPPTLISAQDIERQRLLVAKSESDLQAAERAVSKLVASQELALRTAQAEIDVLEASKKRIDAQAPLASLDAEIASLRAQQKRSIIRAPSEGEILEIYAQPGELVGNQPIMRMADLSTMSVVAEVYEAAKRSITPGQKVTVTTPALHEPLEGTVERVGAIVASAEMRSLNPFDPTDRRVFEVQIALTPASSTAARNLVSAPVDVTIFAKKTEPVAQVSADQEDAASDAPDMSDTPSAADAP